MGRKQTLLVWGICTYQYRDFQNYTKDFLYATSQPDSHKIFWTSIKTVVGPQLKQLHHINLSRRNDLAAWFECIKFFMPTKKNGQLFFFSSTPSKNTSTPSGLGGMTQHCFTICCLLIHRFPCDLHPSPTSSRVTQLRSLVAVEIFQLRTQKLPKQHIQEKKKNLCIPLLIIPRIQEILKDFQLYIGDWVTKQTNPTAAKKNDMATPEGRTDWNFTLTGILNTGFQNLIPRYTADQLAQWLTSKPCRSTTFI